MEVFRLIKKVALVFLPVAVYFMIFIYFEPYDYFGLKNTEYSADSAIVRVRKFREDPADVIILGDSRVAHLNMDLVEKYVGRPVSNLSFGGAALNECMDLWEYALEENPDIDTIYFSVSFYTLNKNYYKDRMSRIRQTAENPLAYMLNFNYNIEMLNEIRYFLRGEKNVADDYIGSWGKEDYFYPDGSPRKYRKNLEEYALDSILPACQGYEFDQEDIARYFDLCRGRRDKGIKVYTVLPPMDSSIKDLVVDELGLGPGLLEFVSRAKEYSRVINFEYGGEYEFGDDRFYDGFHMDGEKGLPTFTRLLFER